MLKQKLFSFIILTGMIAFFPAQSGRLQPILKGGH